MDDPYVGKTLNEYFIGEVLGKGAFGHVYLVYDKQRYRIDIF